MSVAEPDSDPLDDVDPAGVERDHDRLCVGGAVCVCDPLELVDVALGVVDDPIWVELDEFCVELAVAAAPT